MASYIDWGLVRELLPSRPKDSHKGLFGHVFILAGARGYAGAAKLAVEAAGRSGAGLFTLGVPEPVCDVVAAGLLECMTLPLPATVAQTFAKAAVEPALEFAATKSAVVLGPGVTQHPETRDFTLEFVERCPVPLLVDADALNNLSSNTSVITSRKSGTILTPHPGEMARIMGITTAEVQHDRENAAISFANAHRCVVVLKGYRTIVADESGTAYVNSTGNSGLASGGSGDVLSGLTGGLLAQGMTCMNAAFLGVYLHGLAGDIAAEIKTERGMLARDIIEAIPSAWRKLEQGT